MDNTAAYRFDPADEYLFYDKPLSRAASFDRLVRPAASTNQKTAPKVKIYDPNVRNQMQKLKPHQPWFLGTMTVLQIIALGISLWLNYQSTGEVIEMDPFNFMIGPTSGTLIRMGARFMPCMKPGTGYDVLNAYTPCPSGISGTAPEGQCFLSDLCGAMGYTGPDQWWRFFSAIMLHSGVVHLMFNLALQVQDMGPWRIAFVYIVSGVGGFIFGASISDIRVPSVGASGSLYGMFSIYLGLIGCLLLDLIQNWSLIKRPWLEFLKLMANIIVSFAIGFQPSVDNLAHFGGFLVGILAGLLVMPKIYFSKADRYRKTAATILSGPLLILFIVMFTLAFYNNNNFCGFCKYFNCLPGMFWCESKLSQTTYVNITTIAPSRLLAYSYEL